MAIFRQLHRDGQLGQNKLFFSNRTAADIIYEAELQQLFGHQATFILTKEQQPSYLHDYINVDFLKAHITDLKKPVYVCGPDKMVEEIRAQLIELGANPQSVIFEK